MNQNDELRLGIEKMSVDISAQQEELLLKYMSLLQKWNKVYNLTAIRNPGQVVSHHLLDSLSVLPYLWSGRWLDVGCGAGLPGLVLGIVRPQWNFTLLDSNSKKVGFVQQVIIELGLKNVSVSCARVEDFRPLELYDGIISRAFTELGGFLKVTRHLISEQGRWAAMKGWVDKELQTVPVGWRVDKVISLQVPKLDAARCLVVVSCDGANRHD
ncbi:MAG: 16S rRNA (guanine(527)-N(7))-methyltransferase RsmG [Gallionella sp.]|nr:16S rRNA (guanine(527)-N(7))-methyltransferase RsmG [Gallionella sp.]